MTFRRPAILVSNPVSLLPNLRSKALWARPRIDYVELARLLDAHLMGYAADPNGLERWISLLERKAKVDVIEAWRAARMADQYSTVLSTSEKIGLPFAAIGQMRNESIPHTMVAHKLSSGLKRFALSYIDLSQAFARIICASRWQATYVTKSLGLPAGKTTFLPEKVDSIFFAPVAEDDDAYVLAVGRELRDYTSFAKALQGTGIRGVIVSGSPWSTSRPRLPEDTAITYLHSLSYPELRSVYAKARAVIVPLHASDYAAGVTTVLEAMAMARPLIVSDTDGMRGYVKNNETGLLVRPENPQEIRAALLSLWEKPQERCRLGTNARNAIEARFTLDTWLDAMTSMLTLSESLSN
jgi:glycosyltransferase involved in cell wall biosynthesis